MGLNWNKIEKVWLDFTDCHQMNLEETEQHLLTNKRQVYYAVEKKNDFEIHYRNVFYKLDSMGVGNDFRIAIPINTDMRLKIFRANLLARSFLKRNITIKSKDSFELDENINSVISNISELH